MAQLSPTAEVPGHAGVGGGVHRRREAPWWLLPLTVFLFLGAFIVYSFWTAMFQGFKADCALAAYHCGPYLSPFYSPQVGDTPLGHPFNSSAMWILPIPLLFRATCYYYRKAYYRSFFWDPPACAVGELRRREYHGETRFPGILNNLHRYFMYAATVVLVFLWIDAVEAFTYNGQWYLGLGTLLMVVNVILLTGYTFSCHSVRHLVGGGLNCFSKARLGAGRFRLWHWFSSLNEHHPSYAWLSLSSVALVDIYIRLLQHGVFIDPHITF